MKRCQLFRLFSLFLLSTLVSSLGCTEKPEETVMPGEEDTITIPQAEYDALVSAYLEEALAPHREAPECKMQTYARNTLITPPTPDAGLSATFLELAGHRQQFQGSVMADNFRILRYLTDSDIYQEHLANIFGTPLQTPAVFWRTTSSQATASLALFAGFMETPTEADIELLQQIIWYERAVLVAVDGNVCAKAFGGEPVSLSIPPHIEQPLIRAYTSETYKQWIRRDTQAYKAFEARYKTFIENVNHTARKKVRGFLNAYGPEDGFIWLSLHEPALTELILSNSTDEAAFWGWVNSFCQ